jgi:hypothetical protein
MWLALTLLALLAPASALAHQNSVARLELEVRGARVELVLRATPYDLAPTLAVPPAVRPLPELYRAKPDAVLANIVPYLTLSLRPEGMLCRLDSRRLEVTATEVAARLGYRCPRRPEHLELRYDLLFDDDPAHRAFLSVHEDGRVLGRSVLDRDHRSHELARPGSSWASAWSFLRLGIEHIFTGYDHVLFLVALLLTAGVRARPGLEAGARERLALRPALRYLLAVVTSFTLAHSLTLALSALEVLALPPRIVEPGIALTILYVSLENLLLREARLRALLTFGFGLVHGFGFAHILREVGLPQRGLVVSLAAFNLGVEVGQLCVVLLLLPAILLLARERTGLRAGALLCLILAALFGLLALAGVRSSWQGPVVAALVLGASVLAARHGYRRAVVQGGSLLIALVALLWFAERLLGRTLLGGILG